ARACGIECPRFAPLVQPLRVTFEESNASVAGGRSGQGVGMERKAITITEVEIPTHEPIRIDCARASWRAPVEGKHAGRRLVATITRTDRAPPHERTVLVGTKHLTRQIDDHVRWPLYTGFVALRQRAVVELVSAPDHRHGQLLEPRQMCTIGPIQFL